MPEINISADIYSDDFWKQLFEIINENFQLTCVEYAGITYINDEDADEVQAKIEVDNDQDIRYIYVGKFSYEDMYDEEDMNEAIKKIAKMNQYKSGRKDPVVFDKPEDIVFVSPEHVFIRNRCGFNHDERGSDKTLIRLPFKKRVSLTKRFTLYDVLRANTLLKSHKFENNYEMYCDATCINSSLMDDKIVVDLVFDHGS